MLYPKEQRLQRAALYAKLHAYIYPGMADYIEAIHTSYIQTLESERKGKSKRETDCEPCARYYRLDMGVNINNAGTGLTSSAVFDVPPTINPKPLSP